MLVQAKQEQCEARDEMREGEKRDVLKRFAGSCSRRPNKMAKTTRVTKRVIRDEEAYASMYTKGKVERLWLVDGRAATGAVLCLDADGASHAVREAEVTFRRRCGGGSVSARRSRLACG